MRSEISILAQTNPIIMSRKTRFIIRFIAILLVLVAVLMELGTVSVSFLAGYKFWMTVLGFGLLLISSK